MGGVLEELPKLQGKFSKPSQDTLLEEHLLQLPEKLPVKLLQELLKEPVEELSNELLAEFPVEILTELQGVLLG